MTALLLMLAVALVLLALIFRAALIVVRGFSATEREPDWDCKL